MDGYDALLNASEYEHVEVVREPAAGLLSVIAVHNTALGPAMGGVRRASYPSLQDAIEDALRLSAAMTVKSSLAGLPLGGGKSVIVDGSAIASPELLDAFGEQLRRLGGRYVAAEDIGTSPRDMDRLALHTRWVAGGSPRNGGSGDPSPATARTVLAAIENAFDQLDADLEGARAGVIGVGKVGAALARMLAARGARVTVADVNPARAAAVATAIDGSTCEPGEMLGRSFDVLAPCARGGVITAASASRLRVRVLCGAANNMLAADALADDLAAAGVLYVPDFLANAGGIVQAGGELLGWSPERIHASVASSIALGRAILQDAAREGTTPLRLATERALTRVRHAEAARRGGAHAPADTRRGGGSARPATAVAEAA